MPPSPVHEYKKKPVTLEDTLNLLKKLVIQHRIRLEETFRDYDPLRSGIITIPQFYSALGSIKFPRTTLSDEHYKVIADKYKIIVDGYDKFHYRNFLDDMSRGILSYFIFNMWKSVCGTKARKVSNKEVCSSYTFIKD